MKLKTDKYHNFEEGDCGSPIRNYFKKRFWKRNDRKRYLRRLFTFDNLYDDTNYQINFLDDQYYNYLTGKMEDIYP